ncbi:hypothetical protein GCM10010343_29790 [Streptomyces avidinii]|nr:hypothetical protein GCM10010343_29790 [Streptomyces avidinii]
MTAGSPKGAGCSGGSRRSSRRPLGRPRREHSHESHYRPGFRLVGFEVEASDRGGPAARRAVARVDMEQERILLGLDRDRVKDAPEYDKREHRGDAAYRERLGRYYERNRL